MRKQRKISLNIGASIDKIISSCTTFEREVLAETCRIPPGTTITYAELAQRIGRPRAQRAVGQALKKNPLPLLIPCHRVVAAGHKLGGYALGPGLKQTLLDFEKLLMCAQEGKHEGKGNER